MYWDRGYDEIITPNIYNLDLVAQVRHALALQGRQFALTREE
jgi:threonyl-tRNA synthetase